MKEVCARWIRAAKWVAVGAVLLAILSAFRHYSAEVQRHVTHIEMRVLLGGYLLCVLSRILSSAGWVMTLRAMRQRMPLLSGMRLWLTAESMRWLPGGIWGYASRVSQASRNGVSFVVASASLPLEILITLVGWALVAGGGVVGSGRSVDWRAVFTPRVLAFCAGGLLAGLAVLFLSVRLFPESRIGGKLKKLGTDLEALRTFRLRWPVLAGALALYAGLCGVNGLAFFLVIRSVFDGALNPLAVIGINACGWLVGFLAIGVPGGIGVREACAAMLLSALMPLPSAITSCFLWRLVMILDESTCLSACILSTLFANLNRRSAVTSPPAAGGAGDLPYEPGQKEADHTRAPSPS